MTQTFRSRNAEEDIFYANKLVELMYNNSSVKRNAGTRDILRAEFVALLYEYTYTELEKTILYLGMTTNKGWYSLKYLKASINDLLLFKLNTEWENGAEPVKTLETVSNVEKQRRKKKFNFTVDESLF